MTLIRTQCTELRDLATRYLEVCHSPANTANREKWRRINALQAQPPVIWTFPDWRAWFQLIPQQHFIFENDPLWSAVEWPMRTSLYHFEHLHDDHACEPVVRVPAAISHSGWGLEITQIGGEDANAAWHYDSPLKTEADIERLTLPDLMYDAEKTERRVAAVREVVGDLLPVVPHVSARGFFDTTLIIHLCALRGIDQVFEDMYDRPEWLHQVLDLLMRGNLHLLDQAEAMGILNLNNTDDYTGSGALGYSDQLPARDCTGVIRLKDLWGHSEAQEYSLVSPAMHEEFALRYQIPLLERFGLNCYGCCEPLHHKFDLVKHIPNLRRVSVSPWCDIEVATEALQDQYVFNWKPNPADLLSGWDDAQLRHDLTHVLQVTQGCRVEMIMKDVQTLGEHSERLARWIQIARQCADDVYGA